MSDGQSLFARIRSSFVGMIMGLVLAIGMVAMLFWNEGRAVTTARSLAEGAGIVVSVSPAAVDPANEGRLVHVSGPVGTDHVPADADFGIAEAAIRLVRKAEMFQWRETSRTHDPDDGGETVRVYSYATGWESSPVDSSRFNDPAGHQNPPMEVQGRTFQVPDAALGGFRLDQRVLDRIGGARPVALTPDRTETIQQAVGAGVKASVVDGRIYLGVDPREPRVGDYRIGYDMVPLGPVSIVARQSGDGLEPYQTRAGDRILMVSSGAVSADAMFEEAISGNTVLTWILRVAGLGLLGLGFILVLGPISMIGGAIPLIGGLVRLGLGIVAFMAAAVIGSATIALAWIFYRPVAALLVLAAGLGAAWLLARYRGRRAPMPPPSEPAGAG